jgi:AcrR family transcriptional regulator
MAADDDTKRAFLPEASAERGRYHHGNLKAALVDTAIALVEERGVRGFSLAEVSRRLGVSVSAPYRHFADRDALLAAVVGRAFDTLAAMLEAESAEAGDPTERLARAARAFVRFAAADRPLFETLFSAGVDKTAGGPELERTGRYVGEAFLGPARELSGGDAVAGEHLGLAVVAAAHGYAALLGEGAFGRGDDAVETAAAHAEASVRALVAGRAALARGGSESG